jgi:hypothetical protein
MRLTYLEAISSISLHLLSAIDINNIGITHYHLVQSKRLRLGLKASTVREQCEWTHTQAVPRDLPVRRNKYI